MLYQYHTTGNSFDEINNKLQRSYLGYIDWLKVWQIHSDSSNLSKFLSFLLYSS